MNDRIPLDHLTSDQLDALYDDLDRYEEVVGDLNETLVDRAKQAARAEAEIDRLRAGEEPGWNPVLEPTPGQWINRWNQASPETRLLVAADCIANTAAAARCFMLDHESRLADERHAWVAVARVRDVIADMEGITGARHWARILRKVIDGDEPPAPAATEAAEPATITDPEYLRRLYEAAVAREFGPHKGRDHGLLGVVPRVTTAVLRVRDGYVAQLVQRLQLADQTHRQEQQRAAQLAATLREVLAAFSTTARDTSNGRIIGYLAEAPIHPDDMDRWRTVLDQHQEQPHV